MASSANQPRHTAGSAIFRFGAEIVSAATLQRAVYRTAADDTTTWRKAAGVIILAAAAADSLGLYTDVDLLLVHFFGNWSLVPIMLLAIARWSAATAVTTGVARMLGERVPYGALWRPAGYAYAPGIVQILPALVYWLDVLTVTRVMVWSVRAIALPWTLMALTVAARAAGVSTLVRSAAVAIVLFVAANLFDVFLDLALLAVLGLVANPAAPSNPIL